MEYPSAESEVRSLIGQKMDELAALPCTAFADRSKVQIELDELKSRLGRFDVENAEEIKTKWAEKASRFDSEEEVEPYVQSPPDSHIHLGDVP